MMKDMTGCKAMMNRILSRVGRRMQKIEEGLLHLLMGVIILVGEVALLFAFGII